VAQHLLARLDAGPAAAGAHGPPADELQQQRQQQQQDGGGGGGPRKALRAAAARLAAEWRGRGPAGWALALLPSGVGFAVGCYLTPNWTLPRLVGSVLEQTWLLLSPGTHAAFMIVAASGLVLGEGCASIVSAAWQAAVA
jgi:hypothetical protein